MEKQLQAGIEAEGIEVNMGMPVMKEVGAKWLTALYDKFKMEDNNHIITNGFKKVGITEVVTVARQHQAPPTIEVDEDPFNDCAEAEDTDK